MASWLLSDDLYAAIIELRVMETTDIHANVMDFDYYKGKQSEEIGLVRVATLIRNARKEVDNSILVDNGDLLQGSPMGDYMAERGLQKGDVHPVYKAMNLLNYDVGNIGNHEFNYGLEYLKLAVAGANFPYVCANLLSAQNRQHLFNAYVIQDKVFIDNNGKKQPVRVGFIGFVPPQVVQWDKKHLGGQVVTEDILQTAKKLVPKMKKEGADVIIAIPHSGISTDPYNTMAENSAYYLSQVEDIDAILLGHSHEVFPGPAYKGIKGVNIDQGTINGVAAVMPGRWGDHLGVVDLTLDNSSGEWKVVSAHSQARPVYDGRRNKALVEADPDVIKAVEVEHKGTKEFASQPIGKADDVMYSYLALVQDDPTIQIVNDAQIDYVKEVIEGDPDLNRLPVISAAAPFKVGGHKNDPSRYTEVEAGTLTFSNAADLYLYPNTLVALKINGKELKDWLEMSAGQFNQIDPDSTRRQHLINWDGFRTYNFDVIDGVEYQIDVTKPAKYDGDGRLIHPQSERIVDLTFEGRPVRDDQEFIIATNNFRASGSDNFAGTGDDHIAFASPDENRQVLSHYIAKATEETGSVKPTATNNWKLAPIKTDTDLEIVIETSPSRKAADFIKEYAVYEMKQIDKDDSGFAVYTIDLKED
ncbi:bifunctional 2',3'-cyclic-nucleotide 2'-phosphodiesterase/3'-nucleotidase [Endozoicomonas lisbonensis]|uniref:2',3'-cyclic-nucleotide 2'-phosphodiesterase/3'-nucleotidase n=1 Tax=Endozoicomonas lisbonensis TaxID=3120522 RepID=A0ABV2SHB3_9GAMM